MVWLLTLILFSTHDGSATMSTVLVGDRQSCVAAGNDFLKYAGGNGSARCTQVKKP